MREENVSHKEDLGTEEVATRYLIKGKGGGKKDFKGPLAIVRKPREKRKGLIKIKTPRTWDVQGNHAMGPIKIEPSILPVCSDFRPKRDHICAWL